MTSGLRGGFAYRAAWGDQPQPQRVRATRWSKTKYITCAVVPTVDARHGPNSILRTMICWTSRHKASGQDLTLRILRRPSYIRFRRNSVTTRPIQRSTNACKRDLGDHDVSISMPSFIVVVFCLYPTTLLGLINRTNVHTVTYLTVEGKRNDTD